MRVSKFVFFSFFSCFYGNRTEDDLLPTENYCNLVFNTLNNTQNEKKNENLLFVLTRLANVQYDFKGRNDLVKFVKTVAEAGLYVHLRIGPYVCAEWNYG